MTTAQILGAPCAPAGGQPPALGAQPGAVRVQLAPAPAVRVTLKTGQGPAGAAGNESTPMVTDPLAYYILAKA